MDLATKLGPRLYEKTILRVGKIVKNGEEYDVTSSVLDSFVENFKMGAIDTVPFVLVDDKNVHTDDPDRYRGTIRGLKRSGDDLIMVVEASAEGAKLIETTNYELPVSVRITDRLTRADGRDVGPTLLHVAGTFDPEIARLGKWSPAKQIDASAETTVIDLSIPGESQETVIDNNREGGPVATLTEEQINKLLKLIEGGGASAADDENQDDAASDDGISEEDLALIAQAALDTENVEDVEDASELINASADVQPALDLANARIDAQSTEIAQLRAENDRRAFEAERAGLVSKYNMPAAMIDLARPLLEGGRIIELSAGKQIDAGKIVRNLLNEFGARFKALNLSSELGESESDLDIAAQRAKENAEFFKAVAPEMTSLHTLNGGN
jgi:hypothetical protein